VLRGLTCVRERNLTVWILADLVIYWHSLAKDGARDIMVFGEKPGNPCFRPRRTAGLAVAMLEVPLGDRSQSLRRRYEERYSIMRHVESLAGKLC